MFKIKAPLLFLPLSVLFLCSVVLSASPDFHSCLQNVINRTTLDGAVNSTALDGAVNSTALDGIVDSYGHQVTNLTLATGFTYGRCVRECGSGPVAFNWHTFSQQFTAWLLPWLALISQLPYGTGDRLNNFLAVVLTVGSPTLAAYSLALAVTSNRLMVKRFGRITSLKTSLAAQTLGNLQQVSLEIPDEDHVLPSLIVLEENQKWWQELYHGLDYSVPKWTLASIMSVLYVAVADLFTWIDTLSGPLVMIAVNATGESISSLWLCFLPIVIGNLQISPKSDCERISTAFSKANKFLHIARDEGAPERADCNYIYIQEPCDAIDEDEMCSAPVFFYARAFKWLEFARQVTDAFRAASQHAFSSSRGGGPPRNRTGVVQYCTLNDDDRFGNLYDIFRIFFVSAGLAILLQWGTTGAAIMAMYYTPTEGLGCRSTAYLLYGCLSTIVWFLCVISAILAQNYKAFKKRGVVKGYIWWASVGLRLAAKFLASLNAVWLFMTAILQFSNIDNNCWCNSSVIGLRDKAYIVIEYSQDVSVGIKYHWFGGLVMSIAAAGIFLIAINLLRKHPKPRHAQWTNEVRSYTNQRVGQDMPLIANDMEMTNL
ncbi:hypothetical protein APHAL10511_002884 [Amanita phalloides]|nr:hypothetical protein APHAL10511_002884 [Amanita phalloides]